MVVVSPAAANGKREGPMSGGESAGKMTLTRLYLPPLVPLYYLNLPNNHEMFCEFVFFVCFSLFLLLLHMPSWGYEWRKKTT